MYILVGKNGYHQIKTHSPPNKITKTMDFSTLLLLLSFPSTLAYVVTISECRRNSRLPPGPFPFPIIGNLLKLSNKPHRSLATLSERYGPLMSLRLGSRTTIVVSSPNIAKESFTHMTNRSLTEPSRTLHGCKTMIKFP